MEVRIAKTDQEIDRCFAVISQLRPHLLRGAFVAQVRRQQAANYELVYLLDSDRVLAVAGYGIGESLAWGQYLYVDDLVTDASSRSSGHGQALLDWLQERAGAAGCGQLHLDSGVQRHDAHRFYLRNRMAISSHHFVMTIPQRPRGGR